MASSCAANNNAYVQIWIGGGGGVIDVFDLVLYIN